MKLGIAVGTVLILVLAVVGIKQVFNKISEKKYTDKMEKLEKEELRRLEWEILSFLEETDSEYIKSEAPLEYSVSLEEGLNLGLVSKVFHKETLKRAGHKEIVFKSKDDKVLLKINIRYFKPIKLAILIDDVGMNTKVAEKFMETGMDISYAVLPFLPRSKAANELLRENGYATILHMPMAGSNDRLNSRTPGLITTDMGKKNIYNMFDAAIENVGDVDGFNNHMGSRFTSNRVKMEELLSYATEKDLFYIDSKTSRNNVGYDIAKEYGIKTYYCSHFLDNNKDIEKIKDEIRFSVNLAKKRGKVLVIGHYHKNMAQALMEMKDYIDEENIKLVSVKEVLE